jgi:hypothetical protein
MPSQANLAAGVRLFCLQGLKRPFALTIITQNPVEPPASSDDNSQSPPVTKPGRFWGQQG